MVGYHPIMPPPLYNEYGYWNIFVNKIDYVSKKGKWQEYVLSFISMYGGRYTWKYFESTIDATVSAVY
jgi:hypothetical protein